MSIKPVDFQVIIPKTSEISKLSADKINKNHAAQQQQAEFNKLIVDKNHRQVYSKEGAQESRIHQRQGKNQDAEHSSKEKNKKKKQEDNFDPTYNTNIIDIKI